jgi:hypothetical protein
MISCEELKVMVRLVESRLSASELVALSEVLVNDLHDNFSKEITVRAIRRVNEKKVKGAQGRLTSR